MPPLEHPYPHHLTAVLGWLELGNRKEACNEMEQIPRSLWDHPDVLKVRWHLAADESDWENALEIAQRQIESQPDNAEGWVHQSYALHEQNRTHEAYEKLLPIAKLFGRDGIIAYNLACYTCRMDKLTEARKWLKRAEKLIGSDRVLRMASDDPDLEALWPEISRS